ncbi:hypothetical protein AVEN_138920-1 [Araneus ventricosus]|uniref:Uncharacterized protein n=1 Tax=Araneus ventricosus TaxID=182803 RepID=A0A4Y2QDQ6_ARAVE|nr:hypothetical protein AVEN_138920-1 [Araneus ventricosus]
MFVCIIPEGGVIKKLQRQQLVNRYNKRSRSETYAAKNIQRKTSPTAVTMVVLYDFINTEDTDHGSRNIKNTPLTFAKAKRTLKNSDAYKSKRNLYMNYTPFHRNSKRSLLQRNNQKDFHRKQRDQTIVKYFHVPKKNRGKKKLHHKAIPAEYTTVEIEVESTDLETEDSSMYTIPNDDPTLQKHTKKKHHKINHKFYTTLEAETIVGDGETEISSTYDITDNHGSENTKKNLDKTWKKGHDLENSFADDFIAALKSKLTSQHSTESTSESEDSILIQKEQETDFQKPAPTTEDIKAVSEDAIIVKKEQEIFESQEGPLNTREASKLNDMSLESFVTQNNEYDRSRVIEMPNLSAIHFNARTKKDINSVGYKNTIKSINSNSKKAYSRKTDEFTKFIKKLEKETSSYIDFVTLVNENSESSSYDITSQIYNTNDDYFSSTNSYNNVIGKSTTAVLESHNISEFSEDNHYQKDDESLDYDTINLEFRSSSTSGYPENISENKELPINNRNTEFTKTFEENTAHMAVKSPNVMVSTKDDSEYDAETTESTLPTYLDYPLLKNKNSASKVNSTDAKCLKSENRVIETSGNSGYIDDERSKTTTHVNNRITIMDVPGRKTIDQKLHYRNISRNGSTSKGIIKPQRNTNFSFKNPFKILKPIETKNRKMGNRKLRTSTKKNVMKKIRIQKANSNTDLKNFELKNDTRKSYLKKIRLNLDCFFNVFKFFTDNHTNTGYRYNLKNDPKGAEVVEIVEKMNDYHKSLRHPAINLHTFAIGIIFGVIFCILLTIIAIYLTRKDAIQKHLQPLENEKDFNWRDSAKVRKHYANHSFSYKEELKKLIRIPSGSDSENKEIKSPSSTKAKTEQFKAYLSSISAENEWLSTYEKHKKKQHRRNWFQRFLELSCVQNIVQILKRLRAMNIRKRRCKRNNYYDSDTSWKSTRRNSLTSLCNKASPKIKRKETEKRHFFPESLKSFFSADETNSEDELLNEKRIHLIDLTPKMNDLKERNIPRDMVDPSSQHMRKEVSTPKKHITTMNKHRKRDNIAKAEIERISGFPSKNNSYTLLNEIKKAIDRAEKNISFPEPLPLSSTELWKPL